MLVNKRRPDGRKFSEIRPTRASQLASACSWFVLFTRRNATIVTTTLGTKMDEQYMDDIERAK